MACEKSITAQNLAMKYGEPGVGQFAPATPACRQLSPFHRIGDSLLNGLTAEIGVVQPLSPGIGPPRNIRGPGEAPGADRGADIAETSSVRPAEQPAASVGFAPV